jgi:predicted DNA-binding antitoxin AbrB/MazE fold protein
MRTSATFADGVLKPDDVLQLPEQTRVSVVIEPLVDLNQRR